MTVLPKLGLGIEEARLLCAIGFVAARAGLVEQARAIFERLVLQHPRKPYAYIGLAFANLCVGNASRSVVVLRERALMEIPDDPELLSWLAIALYFDGATEKASRIADYLENLQSDAAIVKSVLALLNKSTEGNVR